MTAMNVVEAFLILCFASVTRAHGGGSNTADMAMDIHNASRTAMEQSPHDMPNYAGLAVHSGLMLGHIVFMVLAWFFVLPIGVVFSIGRSRLALPVQGLFLILNGIGVVTGTVYNLTTPDLYVNNAHHSIGWIATWVMTAQTVMSLLFAYAGRSNPEIRVCEERNAFLPASLHKVSGSSERPWNEYRWSGDSGHGTEPLSPRSSSGGDLPSLHADHDFDEPKPESESDDETSDIELSLPRRRPYDFVLRYMKHRTPQLSSGRLFKVMEITYEIVDRLILVLGFIALLTGGVTYAGIFRGRNVFSGLAHFIKGGIFFWYGLLTLGRWMGSFADLGWAWNVKPTRSEVGQWKASIPSAEFTESFVIFLYGASNVFLEHLAAWGEAWSAQDFEHVSISIMFFGGGLCGMLVESETIRAWLNTAVDSMPTRTEVHPSEALDVRAQPRSYNFSMNLLPALIIFLLGIMMSSHHQGSMISTMVHKQWGTLLCGFSIVRCLTYIIMWISPPTSIYPSRPPTELIASFCLVSGGLIFMASAGDMIYYMEKYDLMPMFVFTVTMGFTAFLMAYQVLVLSLKGWARRREIHHGTNI